MAAAGDRRPYLQKEMRERRGEERRAENRRPLGATAGGVGLLWVVFYLSLPAVGGAEGISAGAAKQGP